ncbi:CRISPR-associated endoribonuclease Cas6 [Crassaminicella thermophila]|uniref:CRISPR-associated endoribonuclease Cas6 n=1 Tax=Crassaminicella thermophila TaxID=2599308 RepID=A0A5C0SAQ3_CRATE|nr:CRISPR-associated endoribonuclease Cas6 [Crassaminicella thermophila]QEK11017.1 CRISPR-associated endoribonuclease Cas6 [Crassaminicella thermophila]
MRLKCEYKTKEIPVGYNMLLVSLIKEALKKSDENYFNKLYKYDENIANKRSKNFTFAAYIKNYERAEEIFKVNDRVILNISSPDLEFMINLYNGLLKLSKFQYKTFELYKLKIDLIKEKKLATNEVIFKTLSPICIKNKNNYFMKIEDDKYIDELNYIANLVLKNYRGEGLRENLMFMPLDMKKVVVKEEIRGFKSKTNRKYLYVNSYSGTFKMKGNVKDLEDLYALGVGFKRNQGFGMIEVIG